MKLFYPSVGVVVSRRILVVTLAIVAAAPAGAASLPDGITLGPWILSPTFRIGYETSNNIFYENDQSAQSDRVTRYQGRLNAEMPFRNSEFQIDYRASKETFDVVSVPRDLRQQFGARIELKFRSGDELAFRDVYIQDFARTEEIDTDQVFRGDPYNSNRWEIELSRDEPGRQGYLVRIRRQDFIYEGQRNIGFYDYRGFNNVFEYSQPIPNYRSWTVRYETRRFNHYRPFDPVKGVPFRKENSENLLIGIRGYLGLEQPYRIQFGAGNFEYEESSDQSTFNGLVGAASWRLRVGARTSLTLQAVRRALPSNIESFYVNNRIEAQLELKRRRWEAGADFELTRNQYSGSRDDRLINFEVFWSWRTHDKMRFEISSFYSERNSNQLFADYDAVGIETSIAVGWF